MWLTLNAPLSWAVAMSNTLQTPSRLAVAKCLPSDKTATAFHIATTAAHLETTAELGSGNVKHPADAVSADSGQVLAIRRDSHSIQPLLGHIQRRGRAPLRAGRQGF